MYRLLKWLNSNLFIVLSINPNLYEIPFETDLFNWTRLFRGTVNSPAYPHVFSQQKIISRHGVSTFMELNEPATIYHLGT